MNGTLSVGLKHRILKTKEVAECLGFADTDHVGNLCRKGRIPGAWRIGDNGNWRIHSADFWDFLMSEGISTKALEEILSQ